MNSSWQLPVGDESIVIELARREIQKTLHAAERPRHAAMLEGKSIKF
jgi:hypothetical protein